MPKEPIFVYPDTSVFGGLFDEEFAAASGAFFDQVRAGRFVLALSAVVEQELQDAPAQVRSLLRGHEFLLQASGDLARRHSPATGLCPGRDCNRLEGYSDVANP